MNTIRNWKPAAKITFIYVVVGCVWILGSDLALTYFLEESEKVNDLQTLKGWFYIAITAVLLFWLLNRQIKKIQEIEERWRFALEGSGDGVWDWTPETDSIWLSKKWKTMLGFEEHEIGKTLDEWSSRVHPEDMKHVMSVLKSHLDGKTANYIVEHRLRCKDGSFKWILDRGQVMERDDSGKPIRVVGTHTDISERKKLEEKLKLAATVFTHAREGIIITDGDSNIIEVNDTFSDITGYSREEVIGQNPRILKSGKQSPEFYSDMWKQIQASGYWSGELWNRRKDGEAYIEMITISAIRDADNKVSNHVALFSDVTQIREHQNQLEWMANYDTLTNLPNRVLLADRLRQAMLQCRRHQVSLAVIFLDLDGFKNVNDRYSHDVGDELLVNIAKHMTEVLREGDTLARIGGDEFVLILADLVNTEACQPVLDRLLTAAASPMTIDGNTFNVSASIGVTFYPQDDVAADVLLRHADHAMYAAKESGKNRYSYFDTSQAEAIKQQREKLLSLKHALDNNQFILHYQPQINMHTGEVIGFEALIRWQHPEQGLLAPNAFLPIIEYNHLLIDIGESVIDMALTQMSLWRAMKLNIPDSVSVNVSALQIEQPDFADKLKALLEAHPDIEPECIELEILETTALEDLERVSRTMEACVDLGVNFAIDDFGTGYSSLTYLKHLPAKMIKIDQSFVRDMLVDNDDLAIVRGIIGLSESFRRTVIAEGVETYEHGKVLLELGCSLAQGYGIARPMPASEIPAWIEQWHSGKHWQA